MAVIRSENLILFKARNQEYKDPIEEEWEKFLKVIKEADNESNAIIAEDQEEATTERQIDEIDEQMKKLSRFVFFSFFPIMY